MLRWINLGETDRYCFAYGRNFKVIYNIYKEVTFSRKWTGEVSLWFEDEGSYFEQDFHFETDTLKAMKNIFESIDKNLDWKELKEI